MSTPMILTRTHRPYTRPTLRTITIAALLANTLLFGFEIFSSGPDDISTTHVIISLVVAGIVALRFRWAPALGALLFALQVVEGYIFLGSSLTEPDTTATFAFAALFFAITSLAADRLGRRLGPGGVHPQHGATPAPADRADPPTQSVWHPRRNPRTGTARQ